jgi:hypothetical protein
MTGAVLERAFRGGVVNTEVLLIQVRPHARELFAIAPLAVAGQGKLW